jgi:hypothetical protein
MRRVAALGPAGLVLLLATCAAPEQSATPARVATRSALEPRPDWTTELPRLLPGIQVCLREAGQPAVGVTKAWPIGEDLTGVRLLTAGGERLDCVAGVNGGRILLTERVWTVSQLPGEREPLFTPAPAEAPPTSACLAVSAARDRTGTDVGWLSYDVCRQPRPSGPSAEVDSPSPKAGDGNG